ncbi:MAG: hypothetical protein P1V34_11635 [Alphaproteobacteria bacterium]|nr:hypothetical protein [Alphaproteobacteria bacterium]
MKQAPDTIKGRLVAFGVLVVLIAGLSMLVVSWVAVVTDMSFFLPEDRSAQAQALTAGLQQPGK